VLSWDGKHWTEEHVPRPPQPATTQQPSGLIGVSCVSTTYCLAVGPHVPYASQPLGVLWDGAHWMLALPRRTGLLFRLIGLSCASKDFCVAVGRAPRGPFKCTASKCTGQTGETIVERWDGRGGRPNPPRRRAVPSTCTGCRVLQEASALPLGAERSEYWWSAGTGASGEFSGRPTVEVNPTLPLPTG
jgi:hypothetical protein